MLPLVGLIVSVYACARLLQVPIELLANDDGVAGFSRTFRWWVAAGLSWLGVTAIAIMAGMLLLSGTPR